MIQHHNMNSVAAQPEDFVIAPDVTSFDISEFTRADEMARIGETTTNATILKLREMLKKLEFQTLRDFTQFDSYHSGSLAGRVLQPAACPSERPVDSTNALFANPKRVR